MNIWKVLEWVGLVLVLIIAVLTLIIFLKGG